MSMQKRERNGLIIVMTLCLYCSLLSFNGSRAVNGDCWNFFNSLVERMEDEGRRGKRVIEITREITVVLSLNFEKTLYF